MSAEAPRSSGSGESTPSQRPKGGISSFFRSLFNAPSGPQPSNQFIDNSLVGPQIREMEDQRVMRKQEFRREYEEKETQTAEAIYLNFQKAREVASLSEIEALMREACAALAPYYRHVILTMDNGKNPPAPRYVNYLYLGPSQYSLSLNWSDTHYPNVKESNKYDGSSVTVVCNGNERNIVIKGAEAKTLEDGEWQNREEFARNLLEAVKRPEAHHIPSWTERA